MSNSSKIEIEVTLNDQKIPQRIDWMATDNPDGPSKNEAKAMMLSLFDKEYKDTYKIDLWTTEMEVYEMDQFVFQSLKALAETYFKATGNNKLASAMQQFATYFGESTEIIPKDTDRSSN